MFKLYLHLHRGVLSAICFGGFLCTIFVLEDCGKQDEAIEQEGNGEDALLCMLCNAEVLKFSKHCRSCNKCVDGFDHHCRLRIELDDDFEVSNTRKASYYFHRCRSFQLLNMRMMENNISTPRPRLDRQFSIYDRLMYESRQSDCSYDPNVRWDGSSDDENVPSNSPCAHHYSPISCSYSVSMEDRERHLGQLRYCLVSSKQMVGIYLTIWIKSDLLDAIWNLKVSCAGRGLMCYLGNKSSNLG
ncbi:hypothetical protein OROHE_000209 [Orobanche hederae]